MSNNSRNPIKIYISIIDLSGAKPVLDCVYHRFLVRRIYHFEMFIEFRPVVKTEKMSMAQLLKIFSLFWSHFVQVWGLQRRQMLSVLFLACAVVILSLLDFDAVGIVSYEKIQSTFPVFMSVFVGMESEEEFTIEDISKHYFPKLYFGCSLSLALILVRLD